MESADKSIGFFQLACVLRRDARNAVNVLAVTHGRGSAGARVESGDGELGAARWRREDATELAGAYAVEEGVVEGIIEQVMF